MDFYLSPSHLQILATALRFGVLIAKASGLRSSAYTVLLYPW